VWCITNCTFGFSICQYIIPVEVGPSKEYDRVNVFASSGGPFQVEITPASAVLTDVSVLA